MNHDRIHARRPARDPERVSVGVVAGATERDGRCVVTVETDDCERVGPVVTACGGGQISRSDGDAPGGRR